MKGAPLPPIGHANTALLLHDMQNDFIRESLARPEMQAVVKRTRALIDLAHAAPIPVIYTRVENDPAMTFPAERAPYLTRSLPTRCVKGTEGAEIIDQLKPTAGDYVITKVRSSAFHGIFGTVLVLQRMVEEPSPNPLPPQSGRGAEWRM